MRSDLLIAKNSEVNLGVWIIGRLWRRVRRGGTSIGIDLWNDFWIPKSWKFTTKSSKLSDLLIAKNLENDFDCLYYRTLMAKSSKRRDFSLNRVSEVISGFQKVGSLRRRARWMSDLLIAKNSEVTFGCLNYWTLISKSSKRKDCS